MLKKSFEWVKDHWLTGLMGLISAVLLIAVIASILSGYIWVGGNGTYKIYRMNENPIGFWVWVGIKGLGGLLLSWGTMKLYESERNLLKLKKNKNERKRNTSKT